MSQALQAAAAPNLDPITVEVIGAAMASIVEETGEALIRASYSTNIKERRDCSTALFNAAGETLCQAEHIPIHLGSFIGLVPHIMKRFRVEDMRPGDAFIGNDAYEGGGTHLPDIVLAEPIFVDGRIVAWTVNLAHHADFADRGHAHIYQEGLRIPPVRLYRAGELQKDVLDLILLNCQVPRERLSDLRAQMAANRVGVQRFQALCAKYGVGTVLAAGEALMDYAERKMRAGIAAMPDGTWRFQDVFDNEEVASTLPLSVEVTVKGDSMSLAFDAPGQLRAGINMTYTALLATAYYIVKSVLDPSIPPNAGPRPAARHHCTRGLDPQLHPSGGGKRPRADLSARVRPDPRRAGAGGAGARDGLLQLGLLGGILHRPAARRRLALGLSRDDGRRQRRARPQGRPRRRARPHHQHLEPAGRGAGDRVSADLLRYELVADSGGVGRYRGGMGLRRVYQATHDCRVRVDLTRQHSRSWGLFGGGPGAHGRVEGGPGVVFDGDQAVLTAGQWFALVTPGAGGYGPPAGRDPEAVARDLAEGVITPEMAHDAYGYAAARADA
jgi:N-methylhydantoinase B